MKDICFSTFKSYFDKIDKNISEAKSARLKNLIKHKGFSYSKPDKANTVVIAEHTKFFWGIKSLLSNIVNLCNFPLKETVGKYIIKLQNKRKKSFQST